MRRIDHRNFLDVDLPKIESELNDEGLVAEFLDCLDKAVLEIEKNPKEEGAPLDKPPLDKYRKKKFHSSRSPQQGVKADMRLVYRCDLVQDILYVFGAGKRKPHAPDDIYNILNRRD